MWTKMLAVSLLLGATGAWAGGALEAIPDAACAVDEGRLICWGQVSSLFGRPTSADAPADPPVPVPGLRGITAVDLAPGHACAVREDGRVLCFGTNHSGELGSGNLRAGGRRVVQKLTGATDVAVGGATDHRGGRGFACAVSDGRVFCWGANNAGQLGRSGAERSARPVEVRLPTPSVAVEAGEDFACALDGAGAVRCWGSGDFRAREVAERVTSFDARDERLCVASDAVRCGAPDALKPVALPLGQVAAGVDHTCVTTAEAVTCAGANWGGALGKPGAGLTTAKLPIAAGAITAGFQFTCARDKAALQCWGNNFTGALGTPPEDDEPRSRPPQRVTLKPKKRF